MALITNQIQAQTAMKKQALLIIDIQNDFTGDKAKMPVNKVQAQQMIDNLNRVIDHADKQKIEIIYIGNEYSKWDFINLFRNFAAIKGTDGTKQDNRLHVVTDKYFSKKRGNAFSNPAIDTYLQSMNVVELYIAGLKAEACVLATVKGALYRKYQVNVLTDCIATNSDKKREKMIIKYEKIGAKNSNSLSVSQMWQPNKITVGK